MVFWNGIGDVSGHNFIRFNAWMDVGLICLIIQNLMVKHGLARHRTGLKKNVKMPSLPLIKMGNVCIFIKKKITDAIGLEIQKRIRNEKM